MDTPANHGHSLRYGRPIIKHMFILPARNFTLNTRIMFISQRTPDEKLEMVTQRTVVFFQKKCLRLGSTRTHECYSVVNQIKLINQMLVG